MLRVTHCDCWASVFSVGRGEASRWLVTNFISGSSDRVYMRLWLVPVIALPISTRLTACVAASIEPVYTMASVFKVYEREFPPISDKKMWPPWYGARLKPNSAMRRKASDRPVSTRIRNEMDAIERAEKRCGLCHGEGHTRRGCLNAPHSDP
ncbi:hypothetical protein Ahy_A10g047380 [Arachis hypogaea]|uniref:Uncharacterized protein n=1 Tax=Arachis hypogaea TaxID=3818 RepID=A0A445B2E0_ARAHY|nr:hypothetical protein Ahy_A10g047380 [Arachis hypogaea]